MNDEHESRAQQADWERSTELMIRAGHGVEDKSELEILKDQYAEGKLTLDEFEERVEELIDV